MFMIHAPDISDAFYYYLLFFYIFYHDSPDIYDIFMFKAE